MPHDVTPPLSADEMRAYLSGLSRQMTAHGRAFIALRTILADGPQRASEAQRLALAVGVSPITIRRARQALGVVSQRRGGLASRGYWQWALPSR